MVYFIEEHFKVNVGDAGVSAVNVPFCVQDGLVGVATRAKPVAVVCKIHIVVVTWLLSFYPRTRIKAQ